MSYHDVILNLSPKNEGRLSLRNNTIHKRLQFVSQHFRDNLVDKMTQTNGVKLAHQFRTGNLKDQNNIGLMDLIQENPIVEEVLHNLEHTHPYNILVALKKIILGIHLIQVSLNPPSETLRAKFHP